MKNKFNCWLVMTSDGSYINGCMYSSKSEAESAIKWDRALTGCIAVSANLSYTLPPSINK